MKSLNLVILLALSLSLNAFSSETCNLIDKEILRSKIEVKNSKEMHKIQQDLADEAARTSMFSKGLLAASSAILIAAPFAPEIVLWKSAETAGYGGVVSRAVNGALGSLFESLFSIFTGVSGLGYSISIALIEDDAELKHQAETSTFDSIEKTMISFEQTVKMLNDSRKNVDLDYSIRNVLTLGSTAKEKTAELALITASVYYAYTKKLEYLEQAKSSHHCE